MFKKLYIILLATLMPLCALAQQAVGSWTIHSPYSTVDKLLETRQRVYYISSGSLFYFDKENEESGCLNSTTGLNGTSIADIFYNPNSNYLLVVYATGNMDKVFDTGKIINLPDISSAVLTETPSVKGVAFGKDSFYVLTNFGLLNYDDKKNEVRSTVYTTDIQSVMCMGDLVVVNLNQQLRHAPQSARISSVNDFALFGTYENTISKPVMIGTPQGKGYFADGTATSFQIWEMTYDPQTFTPKFAKQTDAAGNSKSDFYQISANHDGSISAVAPDFVYNFDSDGAVKRIQLPASMKSRKVSAADASSVWAAMAAGVGQYDITTPASPVTLREPAAGSDLTVNNAGYLILTPDNRIIVSTRFRDNGTPSAPARPTPDNMVCNVIDNGRFIDIAPKNANGTSILSQTFKVIAAPQDPETYFCGSWSKGLNRFKDGKVEIQNFKFPTRSAAFTLNLEFDSKNNLWAFVYNNNDKTQDNLYCLPAEKVLNESYTQDDWIPIKNTVALIESVRTLATSKSNLVIFNPGNYAKTYVIVDTKGNTDPTDDEVAEFTSLEDQDGFTYSGIHVGCITEDKNGKVWIGTGRGIFELTTTDFNTLKASAPVLRVNRLKVPRNDGTNLADYLADGDYVTDIAIDASNNKWIATTNSGVIYVSERGDAILDQFTPDNSPLPNKTVYAVQTDPTSNSVWFSCFPYLIEYSATAAPSAGDYSDVYAYPNPVRPDYSGWITVTGLMDNSLVKIADAAGNVFSTGTSNGGMYVWDGCNPAGERVPSGVYYVFASQNANGSSSGAVTKILVVN